MPKEWERRRIQETEDSRKAKGWNNGRMSKSP
jgi:hypothetical protein